LAHTRRRNIVLDAESFADRRQTGILDLTVARGGLDDDYVDAIETALGAWWGGVESPECLCVTTVPGAENLEARCRGIIEGVTAAGLLSKQLPLPASSFGDKTVVSEAIKSTLIQDKSVDGVVVMMGNQDADSAAIAIEQAGVQNRLKLGDLDRIKQGKQKFASTSKDTCRVSWQCFCSTPMLTME
jgi:hypothetical protein